MISAARDYFLIFHIDLTRKKLKQVEKVATYHYVALIVMTPMCKYVAVLLITGDLLIYETLTGIFVCGVATDKMNALGVWIGHEKIENEFKVEGQLHMPASGDNKLYSMLTEGSSA